MANQGNMQKLPPQMGDKLILYWQQGRRVDRQAKKE